MNFDQCSNVTNQKIICLKENKSVFKAINNSKESVTCIKVDGCLITGHQPKCDYLLYINSNSLLLYIELKGCGIDDALKQLENTVKKVRSSRKFNNMKERAIISSSNVPSYLTTFQKKIQQFKRKVGIIVEMKRSPHELHVS